MRTITFILVVLIALKLGIIQDLFALLLVPVALLSAYWDVITTSRYGGVAVVLTALVLGVPAYAVMTMFADKIRFNRYVRKYMALGFSKEHAYCNACGPESERRSNYETCAAEVRSGERQVF